MTRFLSCCKAMLVMAAGIAASTDAYAETCDLGTLVPGETYSYPVYTEVTGEYTPSVTGPVKFKYTSNPLAIYTSKSHSDESLVDGSHSYVDGGQMITYDKLEAGTTYYVYSNMTMMEGSLTIYEGKTDLVVTDVSPSLGEGEMFSVSSNYTIGVGFNSPVTVGSAILLAGDARCQVSASVSNAYVTCNVADAIMNFYREGSLKEGDVMTLRLLNIADATDPENQYGEKGKLEIDFKMAAKPGELVEVVNADVNNLDNEFCSYYTTGDDAGKITFVFDRELALDNEPVAKLSYGNPDNIEVGVYTEYIPGVNEGTASTFDFSGKLRRPIDMLPTSTSDSQPDYLHILFGNICTADGQRVYTGRQSNPTGYSTSFRLNVLQYTISTDFTPRRGSVLAPGAEMEIWVMNGSKVNSEGIRFDYVSGGESASYILPMEEVKVEVDPYSEDDMIYTFAVPELGADNGSRLKVSFANPECGDGLDHSKDLSAEFDYLTSGIESVGSEMAPSAFDVYNVTGTCVLRGATKEEVESLPRGLYIVNGEKKVIR